MKNICLYPHPTSFNRGCEALAVSIAELINEKEFGGDKLLLTLKELYSVSDDLSLLSHYYNFSHVPLPCAKRFSSEWFIYHLFAAFSDKFKLENVLACSYARKNKKLFDAYNLFLSIGGDNYCYGYPSAFFAINSALKTLNKNSVLFGCSIEPDVIDAEMVADLKNYTKIIARESITYEALKSHGIHRVELYPDPAFSLTPSSDEFDGRDSDADAIDDNTVGINVSPLIMNYSANSHILFNAYVNLITYILNETNLKIALIPHVTITGNDDREVHNKLKNIFKNEDRVVCIGDHNCKNQKYLISKCRMLVAARTHASIAAYSTMVPTLVTGYSVKAIGIAKDIFGTHENYVCPVQNITDEQALVDSFKWLLENELAIKNHLHDFMPTYIQKSKQSINAIKDLF